ncbi:PP2C family protein-serine/threonine phosphatase [Streptomyces sp. NPDC059373]
MDLRWAGWPRHALVAAQLVLILVITVVDSLAPPSVHLGPFLVAAPAITASFAGPRTTAFVGAVAVIAQIVVAGVRTTTLDPNHSVQIVTLVVMSALATAFAHRRERHEHELMQLRSVAEAAQRVLLRPIPHHLGPLRIASVYLAAEAEAQIGGDLYAAVRTDKATRLVVGDVRGKGLEAVGDAALAVGAFRAVAHRQAGLPALMAYLEGAVSSDLADPGDPPSEHGDESFITALVMEVPDHEGELQLVNCGHPPPLLLHEGRVTPLEVSRPAPPLGLTAFAGLTEADFTVEPFPFAAGDLVLLYTDGVIEARDASGTFFPLADRFAARPLDDPDALLRHLCKELLAHAGGRLGDDAAMVALRRT